MAFCGKCGTQVGDGVKFCPTCGTPMEAPAQPTAQAAPQAQKQDYSAKLQQLNNTPDITAELDASDIEQNKLMGILAYLSWLVLVPIFAAPQSRFARFHANQGLVLAIAEIAWWVVQFILSVILAAIGLSFLATILSLMNVVFVVLLVIGILNAANGKAKELPVIGKIRILK